MWYGTCPKCGFHGSCENYFDMSCADECFCPECDEEFTLEYEDNEDDEEDSTKLG